MNFNEFCDKFCTPESLSVGALCPEVIPTVEPPSCCPCKGTTMDVPVRAPTNTWAVDKTAGDGTALLSVQTDLAVRSLRGAPLSDAAPAQLLQTSKVECHHACCDLSAPAPATRAEGSGSLI